jgi:two-component system KDP operon response regulator KdpE
MHKRKILLVDDDVGVLKLLRANLQSEDFEIVMATNGAEGLQMIEKENPALVILDITMPIVDGIQVCQRVREWSPVPIIMLSAKQDFEEKARCLDLGADDYVTKPFGIIELKARVSAVLRRSGNAPNAATAGPVVFRLGDLEINFARREVMLGERKLRLTPTEYKLLAELALSNGKVLTHNYLLNKIWGPEYNSEREYLRVFVGRLRNLLDGSENRKPYIQTIPGIGYQMTVESGV